LTGLKWSCVETAGYHHLVPALAKVGDTFAVPLRGRGFGLCRIVWTNPRWRHTSVVGLDWFGKEPPALAEARKAKLLEMTHPGYAGVCWVRVLKALEVPGHYARVGNIRPGAAERALPLGDDWQDSAHLRRSSVWKAVDQTLLRELRFRDDAKYRAELERRPRPGDVYALPYHGAWGTIAVVGLQGRVDEDRFAARYGLLGGVALSERMPTLGEALAGLSPSRMLLTTTDPLPDAARLLGHAAPVAEMPEDLTVMGGWQSCLPPPPMTAAAKAAPPAHLPPARTPITLATVDVTTLFESWRVKVSADELAAARRIVDALVIALRAAKTTEAARRAIVRCVCALNAADTFIETVEREDLCLLLGDLGRAAGVPGDDVDELVDRERDW
jgi:hypothetical protein